MAAVYYEGGSYEQHDGHTQLNRDIYVYEESLEIEIPLSYGKFRPCSIGCALV